MDRLTINDVVRGYGLYKGNEDSYRIHCPVCRNYSGQPTMGISNSLGAFQCFRCGAKGGIADLISLMEYGRPSNRGEAGTMFRLFQGSHSVAACPAEPEEDMYLRNQRTKSHAADEETARTYETLFELFTLSPEHREKLRKRGLSDEAIQRNGYVSFSNVCLKNAPADTDVESFVIAHLLKAKCALLGVPGFYQEKNGKWHFVFEEGMAIPSRDTKGRIVSVQVRKDRGPLRYKVLSSRKFGGAQAGITRIHFPLANDRIRKGTKVFLTEGPLKADAALDLYRKRPGEEICFCAVPGITNTASMPMFFRILRQLGVTVVFDAFDMDKLSNPNVWRADHSIRKIAAAEGIRFVQMYWDEVGMERMAAKIAEKARENGLPTAACDMSTAEQLAYYQENLSYEVLREVSAWDGYKGIDDYLLERKVD